MADTVPVPSIDVVAPTPASVVLGVVSGALKNLEAGPSYGQLSAADGATILGTPEGSVQFALDSRPTSAALALPTALNTVGFISAAASAYARTAISKLRDTVNIMDFGAIGDGANHPLSERFSSVAMAQVYYPFVTDLTDEIDWAATQAAVNAGVVIFASSDKIFVINRTVFQNTNGGARAMLGANGYRKTQFKFRAGVSGIPMFHFGNNNGHGSYRLCWLNIFINDPNGLAAGNTGVIAQECGNSHISNTFSLGLAIGVHLVSSTDVLIEGRNEFISCGLGINGTAPTTIKTTQPSTDINVCAVFSPNNDVRIKNAWFSGGNKAIYMVGDLVEITGCCCQSVGSDGSQHLIEVNNTVFQTASYKGPNIHGNWVEGGQYKYFIAVIKARGGHIYDNFPIGKGDIDVLTGVEGAILIDSTHTTVGDNRFYQFFARTPQDGRLANAAIYITAAAQSTVNVRDNTLQRNQAGNQYYFEGRAAPALSNSTRAAAWGVVTIASSVGTLANGANIASLVQFSGVGTWQVNFSFNFETVVVGAPVCPVFISPIHGSPLLVSYIWNGAGSVRIRFHDAAGALTDPTGFSIQVLGERAIN